MFKIQHFTDELVLSKAPKIQAKIGLTHQGGRLKCLSFKDTPIIDDLENKTYDKSHAGAILFPFVNRIKEGQYDFAGQSYQLECNEPGCGNAIHGLVFNKTFEIEETEEKSDYAKVKLSYIEKDPPQGFPFQYKINLTYTLTEASLSLKLEVKNIDKTPFLFNTGWHPYFCVSNFDTDFLGFKTDKQVIFNDKMIALGTAKALIANPYSLKNKTLDDCFVLSDKAVEFYTDHYKATITGRPKSDFLQIYAPPGEKRLAIEPMTGISDSFNHKKGIQILKPNEIKTETWTIDLS
ncbi:aldose 1-epimerase [Flavobacteriaceae bacterium 14752]|uniref:aldose 1-epimerase n=1 Tax=Mesohalobacter salilacus TaxID=2491711 RepID=UPI000F63B3A4|nr:aldose 1-epimerase [Flavobacteriaceae bacterium 14752]